MKFVFNVLRGILAFILCMFLFGTLVGGVIGSSATVFLQEDVVSDIFTTMDYSEMFEEGTDVYNELVNAGLSPEAVGELLNTEAMDKLLGLYIEDLYSVLDENGVSGSFTDENIDKIIDMYLMELTPIVKDVLQITEDVDPAFLQQQARELLKMITEAMPRAEDLGLRGPNMTREDMDTLALLRMVNGGLLFVPFIVISVILSGLILLCRYEKFEGFVWLTIVYFICGGMTMGIGRLLSASSLPISSTSDEFEIMLTPVIEMFGKSIVKGSIVLLVVSIVCLFIFVVGRKFKNRKSVEELMME